MWSAMVLALCPIAMAWVPLSRRSLAAALLGLDGIDQEAVVSAGGNADSPWNKPRPGLRPSILRLRRRYEPFLLPNGLRVLLVEDQACEQSPGGKLGKIKWKATTGSTSWGSVGKGSASQSPTIQPCVVRP